VKVVRFYKFARLTLAANLLVGLASAAVLAQTPVPAATVTATSTPVPPLTHSLLPMCAACHGQAGNSVVPGIPSLAGQPKIFLENQLVLIREGVRTVPAMQGMLDKMSDTDITLFATYFSQVPVAVNPTPINAQMVKRGAELSKQALCGSCHMPNYSGREQMPRLAGQREDFLLMSMKQFRDGQAIGRDTMMTPILRGLTDAQLSDLAHYFAVATVDPKNK
jgi:cytochrome c553